MTRFCAVFSFCLFSPLVAYSQGLNNASFEQPLLSAPLLFSEIGTSTVISGFNTASTWNVTTGTVDVVRVGTGGYWGAPAVDGSQILDLTGSSGVRGAIEQTFNTGSQTSINLEFNYSRNVDYVFSSGSGDSIFSAQVRLYNGSTNYLNTTISLDSNADGRSAADFIWQAFQQNVNVPANTNVTLSFTDTTTAVNALNQGIILDNIRPVPEPVGIVAGVFGLLGLTRLARRKK